MKKQLLLLTLLSTELFAFSGEVKTSAKLNLDFSPRYNEDYKENFKLNNISSNLDLLDLKLKANENFEFSTILKSYRKDLRISDLYNSELKEKERINHDIMAKISFDTNFNVYDKLKSHTNFTYYVDNFYTKKDNKKGVIKEEDKSEFYINDEEKEALGNTILSTDLKGSINNVNIDFDAEYKANQLYRFDKDKSHFKLGIKSNGKVNDNLKLLGEYNFFNDLNMSSKPFDPFKTDLEEFPDYYTGDYVSHFKQDFKFDTEYKVNENVDFNTYSLIKHQNFKSKGNNIISPYRTFYDIVNVSLDLEFKNKIKDLVVTNKFSNEFEFRNSFIKADEGLNDKKEYQAKYVPKFSSKIGYDKNNLSTNLELSYSPSIVFKPIVVEAENILHKLEQNFDLKYIYDKLEINTKNNLKESIKDNKISSLNLSSDINLKYSYNILENLKLDSEISNIFKLNTQNKALNPDKLSNIFKVSNKLEYKILENLLFKTDLIYENNSGFNYILRSDYKKINSTEQSPSGKAILTNMTNVLSLNNKLEYTKEILENLEIKPFMSVNTNLVFLHVRNEKASNNDRDIKSYQESVKVFNDLDYKYNVGGKIEILPGINFKYEAIKNLELNASLETSILFEKKVINKIKDDNRVDDGLYGPVDKKFEFRKFNPILNLGLKYTW